MAFCDSMFLLILFLCLSESSVEGSSYCTTQQTYDKATQKFVDQTTYCSYGCCDAYPSQSCCVISTETAVGALSGALVCFFLLLLLLLRWCLKKHSRTQRTVEPAPQSAHRPRTPHRTSINVVYTGGAMGQYPGYPGWAWGQPGLRRVRPIKPPPYRVRQGPPPPYAPSSPTPPPASDPSPPATPGGTDHGLDDVHPLGSDSLHLPAQCGASGWDSAAARLEGEGQRAGDAGPCAGCQPMGGGHSSPPEPQPGCVRGSASTQCCHSYLQGVSLPGSMDSAACSPPLPGSSACPHGSSVPGSGACPSGHGSSLPGSSACPHGSSILGSGACPSGHGSSLPGSSACPHGSSIPGSGACPSGHGSSLPGSSAYPAGHESCLPGSSAYPVGSGSCLPGSSAYPAGPGSCLPGSRACPAGHGSCLAGTSVNEDIPGCVASLHVSVNKVYAPGCNSYIPGAPDNSDYYESDTGSN